MSRQSCHAKTWTRLLTLSNWTHLAPTSSYNNPHLVCKGFSLGTLDHFINVFSYILIKWRFLLLTSCTLQMLNFAMGYPLYVYSDDFSLKMGQSQPLLCLLSYFPNATIQIYIYKSVDGLLETRTHRGSKEGADKSTEPRRHPFNHPIITTNVLPTIKTHTTAIIIKMACLSTIIE